MISSACRFLRSLFDTSEPTFTYRELFADNRFNGADRMGDANQMAMAVSTRVLDSDTGAQLFRASVGELFYFANRNVTLDNSAPQTRSRCMPVQTLHDSHGD